MPTAAFRLAGLAEAPFAPLFDLTDTQLAQLGAQRRIATENPGFPCRISLEDAEVGDELLLLPYEHQPAQSPYRASGPVFVRRNVRRRLLEDGELPTYVTRRLISVRAYDAAHMIVRAEVREGDAVRSEIERCFADPEVRYLHLHNARPGCFSCRVERVPA